MAVGVLGGVSLLLSNVKVDDFRGCSDVREQVALTPPRTDILALIHFFVRGKGF